MLFKPDNKLFIGKRRNGEIRGRRWRRRKDGKEGQEKKRKKTEEGGVGE